MILNSVRRKKITYFHPAFENTEQRIQNFLYLMSQNQKRQLDVINGSLASETRQTGAEMPGPQLISFITFTS